MIVEGYYALTACQVSSNSKTIYFSTAGNIGSLTVGATSLVNIAGNPAAPSQNVKDGTGSAVVFNFNTGAALDSPNTYIYLADSYLRKVAVATGVTTTILSTTIIAPWGLSFDTTCTYLYVALGAITTTTGTSSVTTDCSVIYKIQISSLTATLLAGSIGVEGWNDGSLSAALFTGPYGVAVDAQNNVYITDLNDAIRIITPSGTVSTLGGSTGK